VASIDLRGVSKEYQLGEQRLVVLRDLTLHIASGEFVAVVGQSGCGKSTALNLISGLEPCTTGTIEINGRRVVPSDRGGPRIGFVFQQPRLLPWKTLVGNAEYALAGTGIPRARWPEIITSYVDLVKLTGFERAYPRQLSGGMQARGGLLRACVIDPDVLLMDEPFSGLDEFTARHMRAEAVQLWQKTRRTTVLVTHSIGEAVTLAQRVVVLASRPGRIFAEHQVDLPYPRPIFDAARLPIEQAILESLERAQPPSPAETAPG
jgi:NitT/TauT family transport system ATP-binding protein